MELRKVYDELNMRIDRVEQIAYAGGNEALWNQIKTADPVTGDEVSISDAAPIYATNITAQIDPIQDLNGYDHPWPGGAGYNICDEEFEIGGINLSTGADADSVTNRIRSKNYIPVTPGNSYYFVCPEEMYVFLYGEDKAYTGNYYEESGKTLQMPNDVYYIRLCPVADYGTTYENDIAVNYPATVMTYSPYSNICPITGSSSEVLTVNGDDITIALGRTVYGGTLDVTTGELVVDEIGLTLDSNSGSVYASSGAAGSGELFPYWCSFYIYISGMTSNYNNWKFSHGLCQVASYNGVYRVFRNTDSGEHINVVIGTQSRLTTTANVNDFLDAQKTAGTPLQIVYELAEPITYQLTPKQIKLLQGLNTLSASTGPITIKYQPDNALGYILGQAQEFALNSVYIAPALDTGDKIADFTIGNTSGVLYETPAPEQTTRRTTKKSIKED